MHQLQAGVEDRPGDAATDAVGNQDQAVPTELAGHQEQQPPLPQDQVTPEDRPGDAATDAVGDQDQDQAVYVKQNVMMV